MLGFNWIGFKKALSSTMSIPHLPLLCVSSIKHRSEVFGYRLVKKHISHGSKSAARLVSAVSKFEEEDVANKWHKLHGGSVEWEHLLDPLDPWLRGEIIKCGECAQTIYVAFNNDTFLECYGNSRYKKERLSDELHLTKYGYEVTKYIYVMSYVGVLHLFNRSESPHTWSEDSNWIGFVAVSNDEESQRIGRRDIVMAWRGTVAVSEWISDLEAKLEPIGDGDVTVEHEFHKINTSKSKSTRYNKLSASEQVMEEVKRLVKMHREEAGEEVGFTITGHSLGGALALLNAYEDAFSLPHLPITVISFGAPQVGYIAFTEKINEMKVKTLRIVVKHDIVPTLPRKVEIIDDDSSRNPFYHRNEETGLHTCSQEGRS